MPVAPDRLLAILDSLDYHIAIYDRAWRYTYVNAEAARVLGRPPDELLGRCIWDLFPGAVGNQYYRELHEAAASGQAIRSDHHYAPMARWFENYIYPLPEGVIVLSRDVTAERTAAAQASHRENILRLAQRAGGVATFEWDFQQQVATCSPEFFRTFGLPAVEGVMAASEWGRFVHPDDREWMAQHLERALAGAEPAAADYRIIAADGTVRWLSYAGQMQSTPDGDRLLGTVVDITERKQAEIALEAARAEAVAANQSKDQFLANLSHELRTPLNAILGYVRMLRGGVIPADERDRALEVIERNARAQHQLVEDLLDMSGIAAGRVRLEPQPTSVATPLREALESVRPAADAKRLTVDVDFEPVDDVVTGDASRLQQVFWNLLSNAVKFTPQDGRVTIKLRRTHDGLAEIRVSDSGVGIEPEFLPYVFDPFRQADMRLAREHGGLGLGLAISRQLVELHGGLIEAQSDGAGSGATFIVRLPLTAASAETSPL